MLKYRWKILTVQVVQLCETAMYGRGKKKERGVEKDFVKDHGAPY